MTTKPNLFDYATSELSQDAFLCWLLKWSDKLYCKENPALHSVGLSLLNSLLRLHKRTPIDRPTIEIHKQFRRVDIVIEVNSDTIIMIEDKIHAVEHEAQLSYLKTVTEAFPDRKVFAVFLKTGDQCAYDTVEDARYRCFLRKNLLSALDEGITIGVRDSIFCDFRRYLWDREKRVESFRSAPVASWPECKDRWIGFLKELKSTKKDLWWKHVNNKAGGFWCAWWNRCEWMGNDVYLQIEEHKLCFKLQTGKERSRAQMRDKWMNRLLEAAGACRDSTVIRPKRLGNGKWMTCAAVEQNNWLMTDARGVLDLNATLKRLKQAERVLSTAVAE